MYTDKPCNICGELTDCRDYTGKYECIHHVFDLLDQAPGQKKDQNILDSEDKIPDSKKEDEFPGLDKLL